MATPILWEITLGCSENVETTIMLTDPSIDLTGATSRLEFVSRGGGVIFSVAGTVETVAGAKVAKQRITKGATTDLTPGEGLRWRVIVGTALDRIIVAKGPLTLIAPVATAP